MRNLAEGTVGVHLAAFVRTGELRIHELVTEEKVDAILPVIRETGGVSLVPIKDKLGDGYSFSEIRAVYNYWQWLQEQGG
jgi:hypothetical protein